MSYPTDPNKYNVFLLFTGYVESQAASPVIISMSRDHQFPEAATWQQAWETAFLSMRGVLIDTLKKRHGFEDGVIVPNDCCQTRLGKKKIPKFCEECGTNLRTIHDTQFPGDDPEALRDMIYDLLIEIKKSTNDSWGGEMWEFTECRGWEIPGHIGLGYISEVEQADVILSDYEEEKGTYKWDKDRQFWSSTTVSISRLVSPKDKVISTANDSDVSSTSESAESDS